MPIRGVNQITLAARDLAATVSDYEKIFATGATWSEGGSTAAYFLLTNAMFRIVDAGEGMEGLSSLEFSVSGLDEARTRLEQLSVSVADPASSGTTAAGMPVRRRFSLHRSAAFETSFVEEYARPDDFSGGAGVQGLDIVVLTTCEPIGAMALYGARLGLPMLSDQERPGGSRLLQFACGDTLIEVVHKALENSPENDDRLWGIAWSVSDAETTRARLASKGFDVSAVKNGVKPKTKVFTLRAAPGGVPTLFVQHLA